MCIQDSPITIPPLSHTVTHCDVTPDVQVQDSGASRIEGRKPFGPPGEGNLATEPEGNQRLDALKEPHLIGLPVFPSWKIQSLIVIDV